MGKKVGRVALGVSTGGLSELARSGAVKDTLFGKKETTGGSAPQSVQEQQMNALAIEQAQQAGEVRKMGLDRLKADTGQDAGQIARAQAARETGAVRTGAEDARRKLQGLIARRGLGQSSIGLGQEVGLQRQAAQQQAQIQASIPERMRAERQSRTNRLLAAGGSPQQFRGPQYMGPVQTGRTGGIAPLVGAGIGGLLGGGTGAKIGMGVGQASGSVFG